MERTQLWNELLEGDRNALEKLYRFFVQELFDYGMKISADPDLTQDVIQDLFIDIWNKRNKLNQTQHVRAYLMLSIRRRLYRALARKNHQNSLEEQSYHFKLEPDAESSLIMDEEKKSDLSKLSNALKTLSSQQKEALYLKYEQGLKSKDIAEMLDMKDQSVRNLIHRALNKLREQLISFILVSTFLVARYLLLK